MSAGTNWVRWGRFAGVVAVVVAGCCGFIATPVAQGAFLMTLLESGGAVIGTGSGTLKTTALTAAGGENDRAAMMPSSATCGFGPTVNSADDIYSGISGPTNFGGGGGVRPNFGSGDLVALNGSVGALFVPHGYVSGSPLSDSASFNTQTFASLGLVPGTYNWTWGSGATADSFTVQIGPTPEPSLGVAGLIALAARATMRRCRRART